MLNSAQETLFFKIGDSKLHKQLCFGLHFLSVFACWLADLPISLQSVLTAVIVYLWWVNNRSANIDLRYTTGKGWQVSWDRESFLAAIILETTVITPVAIFLHYGNEQQGFRAVIIANDSLSAIDYRRLMVKLKLSGRNQS